MKAAERDDYYTSGRRSLFELRDHAMAIARIEASSLWGDFGFDEARQCWWATDSRGRSYWFAVQEIAAADVAA
jgi:hypothetical protein